MNKLLSFAILSVLASGFLFNSCKNPPEDTNHNTNNDSMNTIKTMLSQQAFGNVDGKEVTQYILLNGRGMEVRILNYGGTVTNIIVPDSSGALDDVVLGFDSLAGYLQKGNPYFGCIVGRYANRIANARFTLEGKKYQLATNNKGNSLHGGIKGFDKVVWKASPIGDSSIQLNYTSKDGEEGYPGNLNVQVVYTLTPENELKIDYTATTDKATPVNLTNHSYFNLSAGKDSTILGHVLMIDADKFTEVNDQLIPTGKLPLVKGTSMDFNVPEEIGLDILKVKGGYDHNWVLNKKGNELKLAGSVLHPGNRRYMEVYTTQPGIQFYSGNFLDGTLTGKRGVKYVQHAGLCLETQHFPDSPNQPSFPNTILKPGETFREITVYKFSVK